VSRINAIVPAVFFCGLLSAAEIPAGTELHVRLSTKLSTESATAKQKVEAVVIAPVLLNLQPAIPPGAQVSGIVQSVERISEADDTKPATLQLHFDRLQIGGTTLRLEAELMDIDNAREKVEPGGKITGINPHDAITARLEQGLNKLKSNEKFGALAGILGAVKGAVVKDTDPNISYDAGVEMTLRLIKPLTVPKSLPIRVPAPEPFPNLQGLSALVIDQPFQTYGQSPRRPSDITNLMFIGSREQLEAAFTDAAWSGAARLNSISKFETAIAIIEQRGYKEAPVSVLTLGNRPPDLVFQKGNNTFAERHHLRMWRSPDTFEGREVWICSSTHDTGIDYSQRDMTFIHKIDSNIDLERAKVVSDLLFTGKVRSVALVERPDVPRHAQNATGDNIETDGNMAVLLLK
jgi:hypothetical protein